MHLFFSVWIGSTNLAVSHLSAPFLVALCRRKSVRLTAVVGGLVMTLSLLFASFAKHFDQIFLRYVPISCKKSLTICRTMTCQLDFGVFNLPNLLHFCLKQQQLVSGFFRIYVVTGQRIRKDAGNFILPIIQSKVVTSELQKTFPMKSSSVFRHVPKTKNLVLQLRLLRFSMTQTLLVISYNAA